MSFECPCCGNLTLPKDANDCVAYICPVCYWEIDTFIESEYEPSDQNNGITLIEAKNNYKKFGACTESMLKNVRKPYKDETPKNKE